MGAVRAPEMKVLLINDHWGADSSLGPFREAQQWKWAGGGTCLGFSSPHLPLVEENQGGGKTQQKEEKGEEKTFLSLPPSCEG